jgi:hypothetical protein
VGKVLVRFGVAVALATSTLVAMSVPAARAAFSFTASATTLDVVLALAVSMQGTVRDPEGLPVEGAHVAVWGACPTTDCVDFTDANGHYFIESLAAGADLYPRVTPPYASRLLPYPAPDALAPDETFSPVPGDAVVANVQVGRGGTVRIAAVDSDGAPHDGGYGSMCRLDDLCYDLYHHGDGIIETEEVVPPGSYIAWVSRLDSPVDFAHAIEVRAGEATEIVDVYDVARLHATVTTAAGDTASPASVLIECLDLRIVNSCPLHGATDTDGTFEFGLIAGRYVVQIEPGPGLPALATAVEVDVAAGANDIDIQLGAATGIFVNPTNALIKSVAACPVAAGDCIDGVIKGHGEQAWIDTPPGRYDVHAEGVLNFVFAKYSAIAPNVEVGPDAATLALTFAVDGDLDRTPDVAEPGDSNGDGTPDAWQDRIDGRSDPSVSANAPVTYLVRRANTTSPPVGVAFESGVSALRVASSGSTLVTYRYDDPVDAFYVLRGSEWARVDGAGPTGASIKGRRVDLRVIDGGPTDGDGVVNGSVLVTAVAGTNGVDGASIVEGPVGFVESNDAQFAIDAPLGSTLSCSLDLGAFESCDNTPSFSGLAYGEHVLVVQAIAGGHAGPADFRVWFAGMPAGSRATGGPTGVTHSTSARFDVQPSGDVTCMLDFGDLLDCGGAFEASGLDAGPHVLLVFDGRGPSGLSDLRYWVVDRPTD